MILEDFVMLGTTVPEPMKKTNRVSVCSAGYSAEYGGLVRLYPLSMREIPKRWHMFSVPVEKPLPQHDSRPESFKIQGDRDESAFDQINAQFHEVGAVTPPALARKLGKHVVDSIAEANTAKLSLAIVEPFSARLTFDENDKAPDADQMSLFHELITVPKYGSKRYPHIPRINFVDQRGDEHNLQLRDWGCYEFLRKNPADWCKLDPHLTPNSSLLIGNLNNIRRTWLVISVLNGLRSDQESLFEVAS